eukprot:4032863-Pyramimonas_sp.AAC.1
MPTSSRSPERTPTSRMVPVARDLQGDWPHQVQTLAFVSASSFAPIENRSPQFLASNHRRSSASLSAPTRTSLE